MPSVHAPITVSEALRSARETRRLEIGSNILRELPKVFHEQFGDIQCIIVADEGTHSAAGNAVSESLSLSGIRALAPFLYSDKHLYAEHDYVIQLEQHLKKSDAVPIAVGSGTINDLTKLAAHRVGRPYMCVATAASMDGYTAFGASITHNGSKQTFACP